jgi:hypothetical protein
VTRSCSPSSPCRITRSTSTRTPGSAHAHSACCRRSTFVDIG